MSTQHDEPSGFTIPPAPLRPELAERFLSAMQGAAAEQGGDKLERHLRRLKPAPIGEGRQQVWFRAMSRGNNHRSYQTGWRSLYRWSAAAALFVLCTSGSFLMMNGSASATMVSGLACRSVLESRAGDAVQWQEGQPALRSCEVLYEDSFVLDGEEESTITVRVPVRTQVMIEEEVI